MKANRIYYNNLGFLSRRASIFCLAVLVVMAGLATLNTQRTEADGEINVYYSVGQNTTDHKTGTPTLTISGGVGTFSVAQVATNMGVGDKVTFNTSTVCYISSKTSTTVWNLITATGTTCGDVTGATVDSIAHAFSSLSAAVGGATPGASGTSFLNSSDLTTDNYILNIPLYYDSGADATAVTISGFTTGVNNYIKIYTPNNISTEVNQSQRHSGKWDTTKWHHSLSASFAYSFIIRISYVRIDGLQFRNTHASGSGIINYLPTVTSNPDNVYLSNSIFYNTDNAANAAINFPSLTSSSGTKNVYIWNNIVQGFVIGISTSNNWLTGIFQIYNNTFYNLSTVGINLPGFGTTQEFYLINNLFASSTAAVGGIVDGGINGSDNNATDLSSLGYTVSGGGNDNDRVSQTFTFADTASNDFHLLAGDAGARDFGADLSGDLNLPITSDTDGDSRPFSSAFDIGADEYDGLYGDSSPPVRSSGLPTTTQNVGTTQTSISLTTSENATCKYSASAGTAYGSMTNTFSTTGGTSQSTTVTGLSDGNRFHYYIRCQDTSSNANTDDYEINFWVDDDIFYAESCSRDNVQSAITASSAGDTVSIPAGTCTGWTSASQLAVNKAITVQGAGTGQTILQIADDSGSYTSSVIAISAAAIVKDMTIQTGTTGNSGTAFSTSANGFRITNIEYINQSATSNGYFIFFNAYGLIDNSDITGGAGNNELIFGRGPTDSWQTASSLGTTDNLIVEDNIFRGAGYVSDCNSNTRCVFRNNTINGAMKIDGHGLASNTPARGVRHMEVYNNTWTLDGTQTAMELRGGTGMIFNNTGTNAGLKLHEYCATAVWSNCGGVQLDVDDYPITDQIGVGMDPKSAASEPMYLWLNRNSGSIWGISLGYGNSAQLSPIIVSDRDYYIESASFNGTSGVGSGTLASRPATCTTGVGYWATDQGTWNTIGDNGVLYKCTSTNTWTEHYTPYAYPHGLTAESTMGANEIDIGAGARVFGNSQFYNIDATSGTTADLSITPASGDLDNWLDIDISTWQTTGTRQKTWTESSNTFSAINTLHVVGDLEVGTDYDVKVDGVLGQDITGADCTAGICTADVNGQITFTYTGGYSEHEFDVEEHEPDTTVPVRSAGLPSGEQASGTTQVTLSLTTDEASTCKYGTTALTAYASIANTFNTTGATSHSQNITGLTDGSSHNYYVRCVDAYTNANTNDYTISFTVASPSTYTIGGTISGLTGTVVLRNNGGDNLSRSANGVFTFATPLSNSASYAVTVLTQPSGQTCSVSNGSGTVSSANVTNVSVACSNDDTTPPVRSAGLPSGSQTAGTTQVTLSLTTDEAATCKYGTTASTTYGSIVSTFTTTGSTSHSQNITGLTNGTSYNYYIRCIDASTNANTDDYIISFSVAELPNSSGFIVLPPNTISNPNNTGLAFTNIKLVYEGPTYYVIKDNQRYGVTNPGILFSYGLEFSDGIPATNADNAIPYTDNLKPGDGSLVQKPNDSTIYLIFDNSKHGFTSETVFNSLGYKFSNVLEVTTNELDTLPIGTVVANPNMTHPNGTFINQDGTIFRISQGMKFGIPNMDVYNSFNPDNSFAHVVLVNAQDRLLPLGSVLNKREVR